MLEERVDPLLHAPVVHLDALARETAHLRPRRALVEAFRLHRRLAEQAIVLIEAGEDAARDLLWEARAPLVKRDDLGGGGAHTAASLAFFLSSKNCSSSVEPCSAVVEAVPPVTTWVIWSK